MAGSWPFVLDVEICNVLYTYGLVFGEYSICNGSKSQNTHFIDLLGAELCYDSIVIYEMEAKISLIFFIGITILFFSSYWKKQVTFISVKQIIGSNVSILILNPTLMGPEKKNVSVSCIYLEYGSNW